MKIQRQVCFRAISLSLDNCKSRNQLINSYTKALSTFHLDVVFISQLWNHLSNQGILYQLRTGGIKYYQIKSLFLVLTLCNISYNWNSLYFQELIPLLNWPVLRLYLQFQVVNILHINLLSNTTLEKWKSILQA
jgi:hypothetical protein